MKNKKKFFIFFILILLIYVLLFEFILPVNKILPKPSLIVESFFSLWSDYNLLVAVAETSTSIYIPLILSSLLIMFITKHFLFYFHRLQNLYESINFYKFIPVIFTMVIFIYWFNYSFLAEIVYGFLIVSFLLKLILFEKLKNIKDEYYITAKNLGLSEKEIFQKVIFKTVQPALVDKIIHIHFPLWTFILFYEFINKNGLGYIYEKLLAYNDFAGIFSLTVIISVLICIADFLLRLIKTKYFNWES